MFARLLRSLGRLRRDDEGVAAVEFALIGTPLVMLVFAIVETIAVTGAGLMLDVAVDNAARRVMVGRVQADNLDQAAFRKMICDAVGTMLSCSRLKIDLRTYSSAAAIPGDVPRRNKKIDDSGFCFNPGREGEISVLRVYYEWPWTASFLQTIAAPSDGNAVLVSISAFMNEPFGSTASTKSTCA